MAILTSRNIKSLVVSDDTAVPRRIHALNLNPTIQATTSWHLLRVAYWKGHIDKARFCEIRRILLANNRGCPDEVRDSVAFTKWGLSAPPR